MTKEEILEIVDYARDKAATFDQADKEILSYLYDVKGFNIDKMCYVWKVKPEDMKSKMAEFGIELRVFGAKKTKPLIKKSFPQDAKIEKVKIEVEPEIVEAFVFKGIEIKVGNRFRLLEERKDLKLRKDQMMFVKKLNPKTKELLLHDSYSNMIKSWFKLDEVYPVDFDFEESEKVEVVQESEPVGIF